MDTRLSLSELNAMVREVITLSLDGVYWVVAEISECRVAANGHCYLELVEKDASGRGLLAKASAHIWRNTYAQLRNRFERNTGQSLASGLKVLVQVGVDFHEVYGYSLNITDIDPTYTLGDMARRRQEILRQLEEDGVLDLNKRLPLPRPLSRIAVVSSASAAGYGDFVNQLETSPFRFVLKLFPATMQGTQVEESVVSALEAVAAEMSQWDAVCIIRGGGAVSDLQGFESYLLAASVAQFPIPVFTGIGHERDDTVIDFVAHTRLKTPTAVAAFLIENCRAELDGLEDLEARLQDAVAESLHDGRERFARTARRFQMFATHFAGRGRERMLRLASRVEMAARRLLDSQHQRTGRLADRLPVLAERRLQLERQRLALVEKHVELASPDRILRLGFSITTCGGRVVKDAGQVSDGDIIETRLAAGNVRSRVTEAEE